MKEQGRQYQFTVFTKNGSEVKQFKSKKKGEEWVKTIKGLITFHMDVVK